MTNKEEKKGVLFDLDGTLWDSTIPVAQAWTLCLHQNGIPITITPEMLRNVMGLAMDEVAAGLLPQLDLPERMQAAHACEEAENEYLYEHPGILYPGIRQMLTALKNQGWMIGLVSNCQKGYIEAFLNSTGLQEFFDDYESYGNTLKSKAENIADVIQRNNLDAAVYIGDTKKDESSAKAAGIPFIHCAYGFDQGSYANEVFTPMQLIPMTEVILAGSPESEASIKTAASAK